ncbi:MAG: hypothetical protein CYG60_19980 [Actinobacteria bacterium]|nr:MAG: hypothetical protein CYG60_19980 [Actinomycetota bacterium]
MGAYSKAAVREGDRITFDVANYTLSVDLSDEEIEGRLEDRTGPLPRYETGVFAKYAALVGFASDGAVTHPGANGAAG